MRISYWSSDVCSSDLRSAKGARAVTLFPLLATLAKARATLIVCKCSATARRPRRTAIMGKKGDRQDDRRRTGHVEDTPLAGSGRTDRQLLQPGGRRRAHRRRIPPALFHEGAAEIGSASCRERGGQSV